MPGMELRKSLEEVGVMVALSYLICYYGKQQQTLTRFDGAGIDLIKSGP
jgi:hypothetical protein